MPQQLSEQIGPIRMQRFRIEERSRQYPR